MDAHSEATRLLCAGARLNAGFRQRVVGELVGHAERPVPPSLGVDVRLVLAHALQARRQELRTAFALFVVWAGFFAVSLFLTWDAGGGSFARLPDAAVPFTGGGSGMFGEQPLHWVYFYAAVVLLGWAARVATGREPLKYRRPLKSRAAGGSSGVRRVLGGAVTALAVVSGGLYWAGALAGVVGNPYPVIFPLVMAAVLWLHRLRVTAVVRAHLGRERFATMAQPSLPYGRRYRRIGEAIEREQHAAVTLYDANLPFVGAGSPYKPWSFALELRRKEPQGTQAAQSRSAAQTPTYYGELGVKPPGRPPLPWEGPDDAPGFDEELQQPAYQLTSRHIFDGIKPQLLGLRESVALSGRDSLRGLDVDECVYLPYGARRDSGVYEPESVKQQLADPDDGGEARRVYLRVRVGSWQEQLVVSLFVRVHTHGGMLVLEVVPHVLGPIAEEFREADALVERRADGVLHEALRVLVTAPAATAAVGFSAVRALSSAVRAWFRGPESAAPDAARVSLRELAATDDLSLFQEMDVSRYIKSVQDRIASGVRDALDERGFRTDRFEQLIMQVRSVSTARK